MMRFLMIGSLAVAAMSALLLPQPGVALEEKKGEKEALKACETRTCDIVAKKGGSDLVCSIGRTWKKDKIKAGFGARVAWRWGDAQCSGDINVPAALIADALTRPEHKITVPLHTVTCLLENETGTVPLKITLAPTIQTRGGRARKVWINVKSIEGPGVIKSTIWTVVRLEDSIGIFHGDIVKAVNKFIDRCQAPKT
ncbi:MAG TPA: hypothetical protein PK264_14415 [Hyphomicrobiaceae bacterium]|nr:hypothetical protein [Hyphomicrobiaceae bacterium]